LRATDIQIAIQEILADETGEDTNPDSLLQAAEMVCTKIRSSLCSRIGNEGFRTLVQRSFTLSASKIAADSVNLALSKNILLGLPTVTDDEGILTSNAAQIAVLVDNVVTLVSALIELLSSFIGDEITVRILENIWPNRSFNNKSGWEIK